MYMAFNLLLLQPVRRAPGSVHTGNRVAPTTIFIHWDCFLGLDMLELESLQ